MARPRVVLVEDDASLRRFVALALEDLAVDLVACESADAALIALAQAPTQLLLTDVMLPGVSGVEMIERLRDSPATVATPQRIAVFSAGLSSQTRVRLEALGVWRIMLKPVPLQVLVDCVSQAVSAPPAGRSSPRAASGDLDQHEQAALADRFGGDRALFDDFRAGAWPQLHADIEDGERALAQADLATLRRLAHSMKSVLLLVGRPLESVLAAEAESAATADHLRQASALWTKLGDILRS